MNDATQGQAEAPVMDIKPSCGNCRFSLPIAKDMQRVECRWGPPTASMIAVMTQAVPQMRPQQGVQQMVSFPAVPRAWHCHRHERKLDA